MSLFPSLCGIKKQQGVSAVIVFLYQADQIGNDFAGVFLINPQDGFVARIGDFFCILGQLDFRDKFFGCFILDGSQLDRKSVV